MTVALGLTLAGVGFVGAFVSGLVGLGGAIVLIPLLYYVPPLFGVGAFEIKTVTGITMVQVLVASLLGTLSHGRYAAVDGAMARRGGAAMAVGSLAGAVGSHWVAGRALLGVFAAMAAAALPMMFLSPSRIPLGADPARRRAVGVVGAALIGGLAGLVGAGGAFLLVPMLIAVVGVPVRTSIGTSLAMTAMSAGAGVAGKVLAGQVPLLPSATVLVGSVSGVLLGARVSRRTPVGVLEWVLSGLITIVLVRVLVDIFVP